MQISKESWDALQVKLSETEIRRDDWHREADRFREKWLAAEKNANEMNGANIAALCQIDDQVKMNRYLLYVNWALWIILVVLTLYWRGGR